MTNLPIMPDNYDNVRTGIVELLTAARSAAARNVNSIMTATYWEIGRRIVTLEQGGEHRAEYGEQLIEQLAGDLTRQFGRGFGRANLRQMRAFYRAWPDPQIRQTLSGEFASPNDFNAISVVSSTDSILAARFVLPWSAYVRLLPSSGRKRDPFTKPRRNGSDGPSGSLTARLAANFTNASHSPRTKPRCWRTPRP